MNEGQNCKEDRPRRSSAKTSPAGGSRPGALSRLAHRSPSSDDSSTSDPFGCRSPISSPTSLNHAALVETLRGRKSALRIFIPAARVEGYPRCARAADGVDILRRSAQMMHVDRYRNVPAIR